LNHPTTNERGFWVERTQDAPGTLVGRAFGSTFLVRQGNETQTQCESRLSSALQSLVGGNVTVKVRLLASDWPAVTLDPERGIEVAEAR
jgi:hypothetical protein